jgi:hypothetical protein
MFRDSLWYHIFLVCGCGLSYPAHNVHAQYYIVICGLSGSTVFFDIIPQSVQFSEKHYLTHVLILSKLFF